jgi:hypothetical protein
VLTDDDVRVTIEALFDIRMSCGESKRYSTTRTKMTRKEVKKRIREEAAADQAR